MKIERKPTSALFFIVVLAFSPAQSGGPGTTGPDFLLDITDARALGLAGSMVAFSRNGAAVDANPAVLGDLPNFEAGFIHRIAWAGLNTQRLNFLHPGGKLGGFGLTFSRRSVPRIDNPTDTPDLDPPVVSWDSRLSLDWGRKMARRLSLGAKIDLGLSRLGSIYGGWGSLGLGVLHTLGEGWTTGLALRQLGFGPKFLGARSPLPFSLEVGGNRRLELGTAQQLDFLVSARWQRGMGLGASFGLEWKKAKGLSLRGGYRISQEESLLSGPSLGFSYSWKAKGMGFVLDYAWKPIQPGLGSIHSDHWLGFRLSWGGTRPSANASVDLAPESMATQAEQPEGDSATPATTTATQAEEPVGDSPKPATTTATQAEEPASDSPKPATTATQAEDPADVSKVPVTTAPAPEPSIQEPPKESKEEVQSSLEGQ